MTHKYISTQSHALLAYFNEKKQQCFSYPEAASAFPKSSESALKELLSDMVRRGL